MKPTDEQIARRYIALKQSAQARGFDFNLSLTSVKNLLSSSKCYYTGNRLNYVKDHPNQLTVDRLDNTKGYVKGNVVACSKWFNVKKGDLTPYEIKLLYKKVGEV